MITLKINENEAGQRLDRFMKKYLKTAPLSLIYRMIRKDIKLNQKRASEDTVINVGDIIHIYISEEKLASLTQSKVRKNVPKDFTVVYEDEDVLVVNKPWGLLTHGDAGEKKHTLVNQVLGYLTEKGDFEPGKERIFSPAPVNRLDRNTSGLVIFGKSYEGLKELNRLIRDRDSIGKYYLTIVVGEMTSQMILRDKMIKNEEKNKIQVISGESSVGSIMETVARPIKTGKGYTLVEVKLITGRTHQIRAHLAQANYPIIGDKKYGNPYKNGIIFKEYGLNRQFLHAYKLRFKCIKGKLAYLSDRVFEISLPDDLSNIGERLNVIK
jgi:23S rRNA pseudouridine955/2504/2580 synthase